MAGYLDRYGEGYEQRSKRRRLIIATVIGVVVVSATLYFGRLEP